MQVTNDPIPIATPPVLTSPVSTSRPSPIILHPTYPCCVIHILETNMRNPASSSSSVAKATCCSSKAGLKRGPWTPEEDSVLVDYINRNGEGMWRTLPKRAGLLRCGKSCRLRWMNYLRPSVKRGHIEADEEDLILRLHRLLGNRWSLIAGRIPGRTDNEIKNYWNSHLRKKLISQGIDPKTHRPINKSSPVPPRYVPDDKNANPGGFGEINRCYVSVGVENNARLYGGGGGGIGRGVSEIGSVNQIETTLGDEEVEDVFSSFLNSLMNDEVPFACQNQSLLPLPPPPLEFDHGHRSGRKTATKQINGLRESLDD